MNRHIVELYNIGNKSERHIIGLMSGTSLDGLDIAYCHFTGFGKETSVKIIAFETIPYSESIKDKLKKVFAKVEVDFPYLVLLNEWIGILHADMVQSFMAKNKISRKEVDAIASHGQTVMHAPKHQHEYSEFPNASFQIGDGDHIAVKTGIITLSDFRQKHLAAGGEGAPLAVYGDYLLCSKNGEDRLMLNLGGIGNFTYLPSDGDTAKIFVTDTGPCNTLMDTWTKKHLNLSFDGNGTIASHGRVNIPLMAALKAHHFFKIDFPKTTGPEIFNIDYIYRALQSSGQQNIGNEDILATLNRFSAETISSGIHHAVGYKTCFVYMSGGGLHNIVLVDALKQLLPFCHFASSEMLGIPGDAKEAVLFAVLANETLAGNPIEFNANQRIPSICMGKISLPS